MGDYFKSWRRKIGVMTFILALGCISLWPRSTNITDQFEIAILESHHIFTSSRGTFRWVRCIDSPTTISPRPTLDWQTVPYGSPWHPIEFESAMLWQWHWEWFVIEFGKGYNQHGDFVAVWTFPYWIGIPLTGLSVALLVLSPGKPRRTKIALSNKLVDGEVI